MKNPPLLETAKRLYEEQMRVKDCDTPWILVDTPKGILIGPLSMPKDEIPRAIAEAIQQSKATAIALICEAWGGSELDKLLKTRNEIVMISYASRNTDIVIMADVNRDTAIKLQWETMDYDHTKGRFANLSRLFSPIPGIL